MSANEWAKLIAEHQCMKPQEVPKDFKTKKEIAKLSNLSLTQTRMRLTSLMEEGKVEVKKFRIKTGQKTYLTPHYRITK